jgi:hypothetical protein
VTIRLLDPPLHEFLPHSEEEIAEVADAMSADRASCRSAPRAARVQSDARLPRLPLAIAYPEIAEMQARAIFEAAVEAGKRTGAPVVPEVMVPLIATKASSIWSRRASTRWRRRSRRRPAQVDYQVGTMIELPRACLKAGEIAETAEFFSFGTNDLTQTTFGISRDDAASFLGTYTAKGILPIDPFVSLDREGVGELIASRRARPQGANDSSSASAASTAAIPPRSRSATRSGSTTCRARRSACRSRGLPPRRPRSGKAARARRRVHAAALTLISCAWLQIATGSRPPVWCQAELRDFASRPISGSDRDGAVRIRCLRARTGARHDDRDGNPAARSCARSCALSAARTFVLATRSQLWLTHHHGAACECGPVPHVAPARLTRSQG